MYEQILTKYYEGLLGNVIENAQRLYESDVWFSNPLDHENFSQLRYYAMALLSTFTNDIQEGFLSFDELYARERDLKKCLMAHQHFLENIRTPRSLLPKRKSSDAFYTELSDILSELDDLSEDVAEFAEFLSERCFEYLLSNINGTDKEKIEIAGGDLQKVKEYLPPLEKGSVKHIFQSFKGRLRKLEELYSLFDIEVPKPKKLIREDDIRSEIERVLSAKWMDYREILEKCTLFSLFELPKITFHRTVNNMSQVITAYDPKRRRKVYRMPLVKELKVLSSLDSIYVPADIDPDILETWEQSGFIEKVNDVTVLSDKAVDYIQENQLVPERNIHIYRSERRDLENPLERVEYHFTRTLKFLQDIDDMHLGSTLDRMKLVKDELRDAYMCILLLRGRYNGEFEELCDDIEESLEEITQKTSRRYLHEITERNVERSEIRSLARSVRDRIRGYTSRFKNIKEEIIPEYCTEE